PAGKRSNHIGAGWRRSRRLVSERRNASDFRPLRYSTVKGDATRQFSNNDFSKKQWWYMTTDRLLVTGGAGYIGSHALVELVNAGMRPVVLDNFSNSVPESLRRVERITGTKIPVVEGDVRDPRALDALFQQYASDGEPISCVLHFAALKAVGESVAQPVRYYENNVHGTLVLLDAMQRAG